MIKKTLTANFKNGAYQGEYDWKGGIPLSKDELITVELSDSDKLSYRVTNKAVTLQDNGEDQTVKITYYLELAD